VSENVVLALK